MQFSDPLHTQHAANLLVIDDERLAKLFIANWALRQQLSKRILFQLEGRPYRSGVAVETKRSDGGVSPNVFYKLFIQFRN